jgi:hypothetical protein
MDRSPLRRFPFRFAHGTLLASPVIATFEVTEELNDE